MIAWAWFGSLEIGVIMAVAMVLNLVVAGFAGTAIPLFLERWGADPAVASSVFLTTATDVIGFAAFFRSCRRFFDVMGVMFCQSF